MTKTPYSDGFLAGIRHERDCIMDFIQVHKEQNVAITVDDIVEEIQALHKRDMEVKLQEMGLTWGQRK
jgi:hypothetical protein